MAKEQLRPSSDNGLSKVLVTDDSKLVRVTAKRILSKKFDLVLAEDGEDAWEKICSDHSIKVVFTDLGMPKLDGYGLIQRVRSSEDEGIRNMPMIVITGAAEEEGIKRKVFDIGATDFITKPFKSTTIIARAEAHVSYLRDHENLKKNSNVDVLTGVLNHNGLFKRLEKDISFINRHSENMAIMIFALDDFQAVYDRIGQKVAERIIKEVAKALTGAVRTEDSIGRDGLAKFVVSLPTAKSEGVIKLAKRLCTKIGSVKIKVGKGHISITSSVGISAVNKGIPASLDDMMQCAEKALSKANTLGVGEVQLLKLGSKDVEEEQEIISIDNLLDCIAKGQKELNDNQIDLVIKRLEPLLAILPKENFKS